MLDFFGLGKSGGCRAGEEDRMHWLAMDEARS